MKKNIIINNPHSENWNEMQDYSLGKFCEKCSNFSTFVLLLPTDKMTLVKQ